MKLDSQKVPRETFLLLKHHFFMILQIKKANTKPILLFVGTSYLS